jgi:hypothetical protein
MGIRLQQRRDVQTIRTVFCWLRQVQAVDDIKCPRAPPPKTNDDEELLRSKLEEERKLEQERLMLERQLREKEVPNPIEFQA